MREAAAITRPFCSWFYARAYGVWYRRELLLERLQRVDFHAHESCEKLGTNPTESIWYVNSGDWHLWRVLQHLDIRGHDALFDFGCGKGGVLRCASHFPFRRLGGIEISERLVTIARTNMVRLGIEATILHGDAGGFPDLDEWNSFYLFNPFTEATMRRVLANISHSRERNPRPLTIIYKNPVYGSLVETWLDAPLCGSYPASFGLRFHVYRTREKERDAKDVS